MWLWDGCEFDGGDDLLFVALEGLEEVRIADVWVCGEGAVDEDGGSCCWGAFGVEDVVEDGGVVGS